MHKSYLLVHVLKLIFRLREIVCTPLPESENIIWKLSHKGNRKRVSITRLLLGKQNFILLTWENTKDTNNMFQSVTCPSVSC